MNTKFLFLTPAINKQLRHMPLVSALAQKLLSNLRSITWFYTLCYIKRVRKADLN